MGQKAILIAGGGTGGHVYPGLAVAAALRRRRPELPLRFVGTAAGLESRLVPAAGYPLDLVRAGGLVGKSLAARLRSALVLPVGLVQAARIVIRTRASVVLGVGGYASGPTVLAARLLRRATVLLEPNAMPGATNRVLAPLADAVALGLPAAGPLLRSRRAVLTGTPVRADLTALPDRRRPDTFTLFVFGGSRGAVGLNRAVVAALPVLAAERGRLDILHQTGPAHLDEVRAAYAAAGWTARVVPYVDDMAAAYAAADLVVCRAGANSVAELSAVARAAVLVPFPHATHGHQEANARALVEAGAALLVREAEAGGGRLGALVLELLRDPERRRSMEDTARGLGAPRAADALADLLLEYHDRPLRRVAAGNGRPA